MADQILSQARALFRRLGVGPGNSLLAGLSILFIPIPFILYYVSLVPIFLSVPKQPANFSDSMGSAFVMRAKMRGTTCKRLYYPREGG